MAGLFDKNNGFLGKKNRQNINWGKAAMGGGALSVYADLKAGDPYEEQSKTTLGAYNPQAGNVSRQGIGVNTDTFLKEKEQSGLQKYASLRSSVWKAAAPAVANYALPGSGPAVSGIIDAVGDTNPANTNPDAVQNEKNDNFDKTVADIGAIAGSVADVAAASGGGGGPVDSVGAKPIGEIPTSGALEAPQTLPFRNTNFGSGGGENTYSTPNNQNDYVSFLNREDSASGVNNPNGLYNPYSRFKQQSRIKY